MKEEGNIDVNPESNIKGITKALLFECQVPTNTINKQMMLMALV
jgi:hypothetical protein